MDKTARLHLALSEEDKTWLEDHTLALRRKTKQHLALADVVARAIALYRDQVEAHPTK